MKCKKLWPTMMSFREQAMQINNKMRPKCNL